MATAADKEIAMRYEELAPYSPKWEKIKDLIDQLIDLMLNYRQSSHPGRSRSKGSRLGGHPAQRGDEVGHPFISYAPEDEEKVKSLYQKLFNAGFKPWMDKIDILPGERWQSSIRKAIQRSDFFLACLSANSVNKRGWIQREIKVALDIWQEKLEDDIYLIPVRLEDCEVPESLRDFQWVDLFEEYGWERLVKALRVGIRRREGANPWQH